MSHIRNMSEDLSPFQSIVWKQGETTVYALDLLRLKLRKVVTESLAYACLREKISRGEEKTPTMMVVSAVMWSQLEQAYALRKHKDWWKSVLRLSAASAVLLWCLCKPNCSIGLLKRSKTKWTVLGVGEAADLASVRSVFLCLIRDFSVTPVPKVGEVALHSADLHPSLTGLMVASDLIHQLRVTGKIKVISTISSYTNRHMLEEIQLLICRATGTDPVTLAETLSQCEAYMARKYLECADAPLLASKASSPGANASTLSFFTETLGKSSASAQEPTSPIPLYFPPCLQSVDCDSEPSLPPAFLSITSPQAASSGPFSSWTFLPPSDRHQDESYDVTDGTRRNTTEGSEEELVYLEYSSDGDKREMSPICEEEEQKTWKSVVVGEGFSENVSQPSTPKFQIVPVAIDFEKDFHPAFRPAGIVEPLESPRIVSPLRLSIPESPGTAILAKLWTQDTADVDTNDTEKFHKICPHPSVEHCALL